MEVPLKVTVELGRKKMRIADLLALTKVKPHALNRNRHAGKRPIA